MGVLHSQDSNKDSNRVIWKWEYLPNMFDPYPPEISATIERYFLSDFVDPFEVAIPGSTPHIIDLTQMIQTSPQTDMKRRILREVNQDQKTNVVWSWENDSGELELYTQSNSDQIELSYNRRDIGFTNVLIGGKEYWIDMKNLWQISVTSMKKRRIERNIIPDHKFIWQWQADNGQFINYSDSISRKIENEYFLRLDYPTAITTLGRQVFVDTKRMYEIDESDGKEKPIRRILEKYIRYKWLWKDELEKWHSFSPYLFGKFEESYLNPLLGTFTITINQDEFEVDLKNMVGRNIAFGKVYKINRQALPNDFAVWGWNTKSVFKTFSAAASKLIEAHYILNDPSPLSIETQDKRYQIDIRTRTKLNSATEGQKKLERRMISINYPSNLDMLPKTECSRIFEFLAKSGYLPEEWDYRQKEEVQKFQVSDSEWNMISEIFHKTMSPDQWTLINSFRLQNVSLINSFKLNQMIQHYCHQRVEGSELLFYFSNKENDIELFCQGDNPLAGQFSPRNDYGKGYYFSKSAKACKDYAWEKENGTKALICFWVLPGRNANIKPEYNVSTLYNGKYNAWNEVKTAPRGADCNRIILEEEEEIIVVYDTERCYPLYIMEFNEIN